MFLFFWNARARAEHRRRSDVESPVWVPRRSDFRAVHVFALQFVVIFLGFLRLFLPVLFKMAVKFFDEWSYRSVDAVRRSLDFYQGDFGEEVHKALGLFLMLVDVQRPVLMLSSFALLRCDTFYAGGPYVRIDPQVSCDETTRALLAFFACLTRAGDG